jgi:hypothetical protein
MSDYDQIHLQYVREPSNFIERVAHQQVASGGQPRAAQVRATYPLRSIREKRVLIPAGESVESVLFCALRRSERATACPDRCATRSRRVAAFPCSRRPAAARGHAPQVASRPAGRFRQAARQRAHRCATHPRRSTQGFSKTLSPTEVAAESNSAQPCFDRAFGTTPFAATTLGLRQSHGAPGFRNRACAGGTHCAVSQKDDATPQCSVSAIMMRCFETCPMHRFLNAAALTELARVAEVDAEGVSCDCTKTSLDGWQSQPLSLDESTLVQVGTLMAPDDPEPTYAEYPPGNSPYWSADAPIAPRYFPYNRCNVWACSKCGRPYLRYTEGGGYFVDRRICALRSALIEDAIYPGN